MLHLNKEIEVLNGVQLVKLNFHYISKFEIDFVNGVTSVQISSCTNKQDWINNNFYSNYVNNFEVNEIPKFHEDSVSFILRKLISIETTVFYDSEIVNDYEIDIYDRDKMKELYGVTQ